MRFPALRAAVSGTGYIIYGVAVSFALLIGDQIVKSHDNFASGQTASDPIKYLLLMVASVLGTLSKAVYDVLDAPRPGKLQGQIPILLATALGVRNVARALLISPLVILALFKAIADVDSYALICLLGYQNGFFFQSLKGKSTEQAG